MVELIELGVCKYRFGVAVKREAKIKCKLRNEIVDFEDCLNCEEKEDFC